MNAPRSNAGPCGSHFSIERNLHRERLPPGRVMATQPGDASQALNTWPQLWQVNFLGFNARTAMAMVPTPILRNDPVLDAFHQEMCPVHSGMAFGPAIALAISPAAILALVLTHRGTPASKDSVDTDGEPRKRIAAPSCLWIEASSRK